MAKNIYTEQKLIKLIGTLDKNENGEFICTVENKDEYLVDEYHLNEKGIEAIADRFCYFFGDTE